MRSPAPSINIAASAKNKSQWVVLKYLVTKRDVRVGTPKTLDKFITTDIGNPSALFVLLKYLTTVYHSNLSIAPTVGCFHF